jgi:hypothetical protein
MSVTGYLGGKYHSNFGLSSENVNDRETDRLSA